MKKRVTKAGVGLTLFVVGIVGIASACGGKDPLPAPACVTNLATTCSPQYDPPTFDTIYAKILNPTCATGTGTCHTGDAHEAGLTFINADASYALLLGKNGAPVRVVPNDAACSLIVERLTAKDPTFHMPPGPTSVTPGELCTIVKWINAGAAR